MALRQSAAGWCMDAAQHDPSARLTHRICSGLAWISSFCISASVSASTNSLGTSSVEINVASGDAAICTHAAAVDQRSSMTVMPRQADRSRRESSSLDSRNVNGLLHPTVPAAQRGRPYGRVRCRATVKGTELAVSDGPTCMAMLATSSLNCSPRATKSVSQFISTRTPSLQDRGLSFGTHAGQQVQ